MQNNRTKEKVSKGPVVKMSVDSTLERVQLIFTDRSGEIVGNVNLFSGLTWDLRDAASTN